MGKGRRKDSSVADCGKDEGWVDGQCLPCPHCPPGQGLAQRCGYGRGGNVTCLPCPTGTYHTDSDDNRCLPCTNCTLYRRQYRFRCRAVVNAECGDCMDDYFDGHPHRLGSSFMFPCTHCSVLPNDSHCESWRSKTTTRTYTASLNVAENNLQPMMPSAIAAVILGVGCLMLALLLTLVVWRYCRLKRSLRRHSRRVRGRRYLMDNRCNKSEDTAAAAGFFHCGRCCSTRTDCNLPLLGESTEVPQRSSCSESLGGCHEPQHQQREQVPPSCPAAIPSTSDGGSPPPPDDQPDHEHPVPDAAYPLKLNVCSTAVPQVPEALAQDHLAMAAPESPYTPSQVPTGNPLLLKIAALECPDRRPTEGTKFHLKLTDRDEESEESGDEEDRSGDVAPGSIAREEPWRVDPLREEDEDEEELFNSLATCISQASTALARDELRGPAWEVVPEEDETPALFQSGVTPYDFGLSVLAEPPAPDPQVQSVEPVVAQNLAVRCIHEDEQAVPEVAAQSQEDQPRQMEAHQEKQTDVSGRERKISHGDPFISINISAGGGNQIFTNIAGDQSVSLPAAVRATTTCDNDGPSSLAPDWDGFHDQQTRVKKVASTPNTCRQEMAQNSMASETVVPVQESVNSA